MKNLFSFFALSCLFLLFGCNSDQPVRINLDKDNCDFCGMKITDGRFGGAVMTDSSKFYKFDDLKCMVHYIEKKPNGPIKSYYVHDYTQDNALIDASTAHYVWSKELKSPMRGNTAAFKDLKDAEELAGKAGSQVESWDATMKRILE
ncbi:MAG: nitrous oxide reductase accessory protein NosL [Saprospiraceae bacterium]|nr:nitrous oxide reductase accessory protein NosL [Saprospiraceae bacterium]